MTRIISDTTNSGQDYSKSLSAVRYLNGLIVLLGDELRLALLAEPTILLLLNDRLRSYRLSNSASVAELTSPMLSLRRRLNACPDLWPETMVCGILPKLRALSSQHYINECVRGYTVIRYK
jgi:hypothetical protein